MSTLESKQFFKIETAAEFSNGLSNDFPDDLALRAIKAQALNPSVVSGMDHLISIAEKRKQLSLLAALIATIEQLKKDYPAIASALTEFLEVRRERIKFHFDQQQNDPTRCKTNAAVYEASLLNYINNYESNLDKKADVQSSIDNFIATLIKPKTNSSATNATDSKHDTLSNSTTDLLPLEATTPLANLVTPGQVETTEDAATSHAQIDKMLVENTQRIKSHTDHLPPEIVLLHLRKHADQLRHYSPLSNTKADIDALLYKIALEKRNARLKYWKQQLCEFRASVTSDHIRNAVDNMLDHLDSLLHTPIRDVQVVGYLSANQGPVTDFNPHSFYEQSVHNGSADGTTPLGIALGSLAIVPLATGLAVTAYRVVHQRNLLSYSYVQQRLAQQTRDMGQFDVKANYNDIETITEKFNDFLARGKVPAPLRTVVNENTAIGDQEEWIKKQKQQWCDYTTLDQLILKDPSQYASIREVPEKKDTASLGSKFKKDFLPKSFIQLLDAYRRSQVHQVFSTFWDHCVTTALKYWPIWMAAAIIVAPTALTSMAVMPILVGVTYAWSTLQILVLSYMKFKARNAQARKEAAQRDPIDKKAHDLLERMKCDFEQDYNKYEIEKITDNTLTAPLNPITELAVERALRYVEFRRKVNALRNKNSYAPMTAEEKNQWIIHLRNKFAITTVPTGNPPVLVHKIEMSNEANKYVFAFAKRELAEKIHSTVDEQNALEKNALATVEQLKHRIVIKQRQAEFFNYTSTLINNDSKVKAILEKRKNEAEGLLTDLKNAGASKVELQQAERRIRTYSRLLGIDNTTKAYPSAMASASNYRVDEAYTQQIHLKLNSISDQVAPESLVDGLSQDSQDYLEIKKRILESELGKAIRGSEAKRKARIRANVGMTFLAQFTILFFVLWLAYATAGLFVPFAAAALGSVSPLFYTAVLTGGYFALFDTYPKLRIEQENFENDIVKKLTTYYKDETYVDEEGVTKRKTLQQKFDEVNDKSENADRERSVPARKYWLLQQRDAIAEKYHLALNERDPQKLACLSPAEKEIFTVDISKYELNDHYFPEKQKKMTWKTWFKQTAARLYYPNVTTQTDIFVDRMTFADGGIGLQIIPKIAAVFVGVAAGSAVSFALGGPIGLGIFAGVMVALMIVGTIGRYKQYVANSDFKHRENFLKNNLESRISDAEKLLKQGFALEEHYTAEQQAAADPLVVVEQQATAELEHPRLENAANGDCHTFDETTTMHSRYSTSSSMRSALTEATLSGTSPLPPLDIPPHEPTREKNGDSHAHMNGSNGNGHAVHEPTDALAAKLYPALPNGETMISSSNGIHTHQGNGNALNGSHYAQTTPGGPAIASEVGLFASPRNRGTELATPVTPYVPISAVT